MIRVAYRIFFVLEGGNLADNLLCTCLYMRCWHAYSNKCDCIWENLAYCEFYEILVNYIFDNLYHRANLPPSFRPIVRFLLEIQRFVYDCAPPIKIETLRPKGVAKHAYGVSIHYVYTGNQFNGHGRSRSK